jgi:hypothetical protein
MITTHFSKLKLPWMNSWFQVAAFVAVVSGCMLLLDLCQGGTGSSDSPHGSTSGSDSSRFAGKWKEVSPAQSFSSVGTYLGLPGITQAAFADSSTPDELAIGSDGTYELHRIKKDNGTYSPTSLQPDEDNLTGQGVFTSGRNGNSDKVTMMIMPGSAMAANPMVPHGNQLLSLTPQGGGAGSMWARNNSSSSPAGLWTNPQIPVMDGAQGATVQNMYSSALNLTADGHYQIQFEMTKSGLFALQSGNAFTVTFPNAQPAGGQYSFDGSDTMTLVTPDGKTVWQRE